MKPWGLKSSVEPRPRLLLCKHGGLGARVADVDQRLHDLAQGHQVVDVNGRVVGEGVVQVQQ